MAGGFHVAQIGVCPGQKTLSLSGIVVAITLGLLFVVWQAVGVVGVFGVVLSVVFDNLDDMLCERDDFLVALQLPQYGDLAFEGDDAGVHLVGMALSVEGGDDAVEFGKAFLFFA